MCGGILTGKHNIEDVAKTEPGRFFGKGGEMYCKRFWKREIFDSVAKLKAVLNEVYEDKVNITEASLRWLYHHSKLDSLFGDGVILGASSMEYFDFNLGCSAKGPLDERVVLTLNECWDTCCFNCPDYMR